MSKIQQFFQINWKVRVKNPTWWIQIIVAAALSVLTYYNLDPTAVTSWGQMFGIIKEAFMNPYVCLLMLVSIVNISIDPTTTGISDSSNAMLYDKANSAKALPADKKSSSETTREG